MFLWSFILRATPVRRIVGGIMCILVIFGAMSLMSNYKSGEAEALVLIKGKE